MAHAALVSLGRTLENFLHRNRPHIFGVDDEKRHAFESLLPNVVLLQDFLEKFPGKAARKLELQISDAATEVERSIEYFVSDSISSLNGDVAKLLTGIENPSARIDSIAKEVNQMGGDPSAEVDSLPHSGTRVQGNDMIVGIEDDLSKIKGRLLSEDAELITVPIVGMGGIGKTTLAKAAFDDPAIIRRFDIRRWVNVSQSYDIREICFALLGEDSSDDETSIVDMKTRLRQFLYKRRYLIVVDDVWSLEAWDGVMSALPDDGNRSRVLLTTRDENLPTCAASSSPIHRLKPMDEKTSWILFQKKVFAEDGQCPPQLVSIGKRIARGCHGLPVAIVIIAGILLNIRRSPESWEVIVEDVNGALSKGDEPFMEILSLSYYHLPAHLRHCFLYFGGFPEDYVIHVTNLTRLWVGEGFLKAAKNETTKDAEEIAYGCLEDLVKRNLVMVTKKRFTGEIRRCKVHDLVREICIRKAKEEKFLHLANGVISEKIANARRVSFTSGRRVSTTYFSSVQTALVFRLYDNLASDLCNLRLLRVLDAEIMMFEEFPPQLLQLYHLRYLALGFNGKIPFRIPEEVEKLESLETLIARPKQSFDTSIVVVPSGISRLRKLRHLNLRGHFSLPHGAAECPDLENLKTLRMVHNLKFEKRLVESIGSLRVIVFSCYPKHGKNETWSDYFLHNFRHLSSLETSKVCLAFRRYDMEWCKRNPLLEWLVFPHSLKRLTIRGCAARIPWEDIGPAIGSLPNLEELQLFFNVCIGDVWETREGDFEKLRDLEIIHSDLKCWRSDSSHFPSLEILVLNFCDELIELPYDIGDIPTLRVIYLNGSHKTVSEWGSQIREEQQGIGNDQLLIVNELDSFQGFLKEAIQPDEQLSAEELAEHLLIWAGDDRNKLSQAKSIGLDHMSSQLEESTQNKRIQMEAFVEIWDSLMKKNE